MHRVFFELILRPRTFMAVPAPSHLPDIVGRKETMTLNSGAAGVKVNLFGGLLLTADILFRLDNNGLRQNVTPLIGLSRTFGK